MEEICGSTPQLQNLPNPQTLKLKKIHFFNGKSVHFFPVFFWPFSRIIPVKVRKQTKKKRKLFKV